MKTTNADRAKWAREYRKRKKFGLPQPARGANLYKHGDTASTEHGSWRSMMARCYSSRPERGDFHLYQGKGIIVCDRWHEFQNFLEDMGRKPTPTHTLDRIDSDGNYEPANCRWATPKEQAQNWKTRNRKIDFNGDRLTIGQWAERIGIRRESLRDRLETGWSIERALTTAPVRERTRDERGLFKAAGD